MEGRDLLLKNLCWKVSVGSTVSVWEEPWIIGLEGHRLAPRLITEDEAKLKVGDLMCNGRWDLRAIDSRLSREEKDFILNTPISLRARSDRAI